MSGSRCLCVGRTLSRVRVHGSGLSLLGGVRLGGLGVAGVGRVFDFGRGKLVLFGGSSMCSKC